MLTSSANRTDWLSLAITIGLPDTQKAKMSPVDSAIYAYSISLKNTFIERKFKV